MQRFARGEAYDEQPMTDLDSEAIDFRVASESFADARKLRVHTGDMGNTIAPIESGHSLLTTS